MNMLEEELRAYPIDPTAPREIEQVVARGGQLQRRHRRRMAGAAVAFTVVAALVVPVVAVRGHEPTSSAAAFLRTVAHNAATTPAPDASHAPYWYSQSRVDYGGNVYTRRVWLGHHKPGRLIQPDGVIGETSLDPATFHIGARTVTWDQLLDLPRDTDALYRLIRADVQGAGNDTSSEMFVAVGDLLRESPAPPDLRQALYLVAAKIPGITVTHQLRDATGRAGTGISRTDSGGSTVTYLIDQGTGALLEERDVNSDGKIGLRITYMSSGVANSTTDTPTG